MKTIRADVILGTEQLQLDIEFKDDDFSKMDDYDLLLEVFQSAIESEHLKISIKELPSFDEPGEVVPFTTNNLH
jgi:hypothetical protein